MDPLTLEHVATVTNGRLARADDPVALVGPDVLADSRAITPGALFVALRGEHVDGHDYVEQAARAGAAAALVSREVDADLPQIVVEDTLAALALLGSDVVTRAEAGGLIVVGITGSSGKTSTKDLLASVLSDAGETIAPAGSFNNEVGAPLTACRVAARTRFLVSEMGSRGPGHITALTQVTHPQVGAVLNVGHAHVGEFGSVEGIASAKGELVEALAPQGWAVLNADDQRVLAMASRTAARIATFSATGDLASARSQLRVWASGIHADELQRFAFTLNAAGEVTGHAPVRLRIIGAHQVDNALAAATAALAVGLPLDAVAASLSSVASLSPWRMELLVRDDGLAILNDAYNANPDSMHAALETLAGLRRDGGRLLAGLGDMLELGKGAEDLHRSIGEHAARLGIEVFAVGEFGQLVANAVSATGGQGEYLTGVGELTTRLRADAGARDVVLVKASRALALERVAEALAVCVDEGAHP